MSRRSLLSIPHITVIIAVALKKEMLDFIYKAYPGHQKRETVLLDPPLTDLRGWTVFEDMHRNQLVLMGKIFENKD